MAVAVLLPVIVFYAAACGSQGKALPPEPSADQPPDACGLLTSAEVGAAIKTTGLTAPTHSGLANTGYRTCEWSRDGTSVAALETSTTRSIAALGCRCTPTDPPSVTVAGLGDSARLSRVSGDSSLTVEVGATTITVSVFSDDEQLASDAATALARNAVTALGRT